ncbi:hypothetical protein FPCIR_4365 [Fusarium pseudocircinatum]|uniref:Uncharacterized protein n=1 Tax=Fusarium pseudocircinatum TaxID=56676 RepID=A0A8H5PFC6_9HYPO|nr:hypothetical protein FPCIR_4365 [Fusarium pseudocircinatum]
MDDQFGGRTDDDLFYDDFEPVESETVITTEAVPEPQPEPVAPVQEPTVPQEKPAPTPAPAPSAPTSKPAGLSSSRYADKPAAPKPAKQAPQPTSNAPPNAPTAPREKNNHGSQNTAANSAARLQSGANPRQKLTDEELAAKMEKMKLLNAEKARKFEKAEKDEKDHAAAYARGMEEAKKRRAEEAERRKRGEEDKRRLDDERAKNRERKLKAMGMKEGGWDEGKDALEEEENRRFRGANGGIRGSRSSGLGGSRYASKDNEDHDVDRFLDERHRGGRGRGRGRGGRGGRGGRSGHEGAPPASVKQAVPAAEDFPALPGEVKKSAPAPANDKPAFAAAAAGPPPPLPPPTGGKWDEEMDEYDELNKKS